MAIVDRYEVTILTPWRPSNHLDDFKGREQRLEQTGPGDRWDADKPVGGRFQAREPQWNALEEYVGPQVPRYNIVCRHICVPPLRKFYLPSQTSLEFAVDFKVKTGFSFGPDDEAEYLVFRLYLDDERIGSAKVNRARWEQSGSYRVRKKGRRVFLEDEQRWTMSKWKFEIGMHGTIRIEVWKEKSKYEAVPGLDDLWIDFTGNNSEILVKSPRVRHTTRIGEVPTATFVFEYRSEDTLRILGMLKAPTACIQSDDDGDRASQKKSVRPVHEASSEPDVMNTGMDILTPPSLVMSDDMVHDFGHIWGNNYEAVGFFNHGFNETSSHISDVVDEAALYGTSTQMASSIDRTFGSTTESEANTFDNSLGHARFHIPRIAVVDMTMLD